ncbi:MAG TPA: hypothetical protein VMZ53_11570 [Kofleriaceae bacterium]|nr:hypothetical protein [Kofleriaceae bacterium]
MTRAAVLSLLLSAGCITNAQGRVNVTASTGTLGGALILGGAIVGAGECQPTPDQCDHVERGEPAVAATLVLVGASLVVLAVLFDRAEN